MHCICAQALTCDTGEAGLCAALADVRADERTTLDAILGRDAVQPLGDGTHGLRLSAPVRGLPGGGWLEARFAVPQHYTASSGGGGGVPTNLELAYPYEPLWVVYVNPHPDVGFAAAAAVAAAAARRAAQLAGPEPFLHALLLWLDEHGAAAAAAAAARLNRLDQEAAATGSSRNLDGATGVGPASESRGARQRGAGAGPNPRGSEPAGEADSARGGRGGGAAAASSGAGAAPGSGGHEGEDAEERAVRERMELMKRLMAGDAAARAGQGANGAAEPRGPRGSPKRAGHRAEEDGKAASGPRQGLPEPSGAPFSEGLSAAGPEGPRRSRGKAGRAAEAAVAPDQAPARSGTPCRESGAAAEGGEPRSLQGRSLLGKADGTGPSHGSRGLEQARQAGGHAAESGHGGSRGWSARRDAIGMGSGQAARGEPGLAGPKPAAGGRRAEPIRHGDADSAGLSQASGARPRAETLRQPYAPPAARTAAAASAAASVGAAGERKQGAQADGRDASLGSGSGSEVHIETESRRLAAALASWRSSGDRKIAALRCALLAASL